MTPCYSIGTEYSETCIVYITINTTKEVIVLIKWDHLNPERHLGKQRKGIWGICWKSVGVS